jgi:hypothetical protein|tara:strand:+ start:100 stop:303 length:204 start_codon:yes stop_codon:yes gene_type:complete
MIKFVKAQKSGEYVLIKEGDMDFNTSFASTLKDMKEEKARIDRALLLYADSRRYTSLVEAALKGETL